MMMMTAGSNKLVKCFTRTSSSRAVVGRCGLEL